MLKHTQQLLFRVTAYSLIIGVLNGQTIPVPMDHSVNDFILRLHTQHKIQGIHPGLRPFTVDQILEVLDVLSADEHDLSAFETTLLRRFKKEFRVDTIENGIRGPWQSNHLSKTIKNIFQLFDTKNTETKFVTYHDENLLLRSNWEEFFSIDFQDTISRSFFTDRVTIAGKFEENLSFYSRYTLYRVDHKENYPYPDEYKQGYALVEKNTDWLVWDVNEASLRIDNLIINAEISKIPIYWGYSKQHSPILSANVQSFSFLRFSKDYKRIRARSFIGSLNPFGDDRKGMVEEKNIAAHRFEFDLTPSLTISFNEMVIYARRQIELGYLLPVNLLWSEEHGLGNRDNILMSFDAYWNIKPGLSVYGTFLWDELSWFKLFSPWWGNKFIFQSGFYWVPFANPQLPDFKVEWTASRPWVYTHNDSLLTFTSSEIGLGFPLGPNSQMLYLEMNFWPNYKSQLTFNISYIKKGSGLGSDPNDNYNLRDKSLDDSTPMLLGKVKENLIYGMNFHHRLTELFSITGNCSFNNDEKIFEGRLGLLMNY